MPDIRSSEIPTGKPPAEALRPRPIEVKKPEVLSPLSSQTLPTPIHKGETIPSLASVVEGQKRVVDAGPEITDSEVLPPSHPTTAAEFLDTMASGDLGRIAETVGRLSQVQESMMPEPIKIDKKEGVVGHAGPPSEIERLRNERLAVLGGVDEADLSPLQRYRLGQIDEQIRAAEATRLAAEARDREPRRFGREDVGSPEFEVRGSDLVEKIVLYETTMSYEERYNEVNGPVLDQAYKDLQAHVNLIRIARNDRSSMDLWVRDESTGRVTNVRKKEVAGHEGEGHAEGPVRVENLPTRSMEQLTELYADITTPLDQLPGIERDMGIYLNEARRLGLLNGVDGVLNAILQENVMTDSQQVREVIEQRLARETVTAARAAFITQRGVPEISADVLRIAQLWNMGPIALRASTLFERFLADEPLPPPIEGEWRLGEQHHGAGKQTFYEAVRNYPKMYYIFARSPEQFQIAKDSFLQALRNGALGVDPEKLLPHMQAFTEVFGTRGQEMINAGKVDAVFMRHERQELEGLAYVEGANHSAESYHAGQYNSFMMALAMNEGPQRFVRLIRSGNGEVGQFCYQFDYSPAIELWYNSGGSRGQIGNDYAAQKFLRDGIQKIVVERGMGVRLKDYDPTLPKPDPVDVKALGKEGEEVLAKLLKANQERIGVPQPIGDFKGLYEGFDTGNAHIENCRVYGGEEYKGKLPEGLRKSVALGRAQIELRRIKQGVRDRSITIPAGQTILDQLDHESREAYEEAHEHAEASFEVALQLVGVTGEKVRRGGGVLFVDRNEHVQGYRKKMKRYEEVLIPQDLVPDGQTWAGLDSAGRRALNDKLKNMGSDERKKRMLIKKRKQWTDSEWLGWILAAKLRKGGDISKLSDEEQRLYKGEGTIDKEGKFVDSRTLLFTDKDRKDVVDYIPEDMGKRIGQYAVTRAKVECAEADEATRGAKVFEYLTKALDSFEKNGFETKLVFPKIIFDAEGNVTGTHPTETETIDFQTATTHVYSRWTYHTYLFYQLNTRQPLLDPEIWDGAKRIRSGVSQPEDEDPLCALLFTADSTLTSVKRLPLSEMHDETNAVAASIEQSFLDSTMVQRQLYKRFLPSDDNRNKIRMGYLHEDFGGFMRFVGPFVPFVAAHSKRFDRRYISELANTPMYVPSMAQGWARQGVLGAVEMFADGIGGVVDQPLAGQYAITKYIDEVKYGWMLNQSLLGHTNEQGVNIEGLLEKPTNSAEELNELHHAIVQYKLETANPGKLPEDSETKLLHAFIKSFGRLNRVMQIMRVMYGDVRNAQGTTVKTRYETNNEGELVVKGQDVFLEDGSFNPEINWDSNTGSSRHILYQFFNSYVNWLTSDAEGGGARAYPNEAALYKLINEKTSLDPEGKTTRRDWIFAKMCR